MRCCAIVPWSHRNGFGCSGCRTTLAWPQVTSAWFLRDVASVRVSSRTTALPMKPRCCSWRGHVTRRQHLQTATVSHSTVTMMPAMATPTPTPIAIAIATDMVIATCMGVSTTPYR